MKLLIKSAKIIDPNSPHNGATKDILIDEGIIVKIASEIPKPPRADEFSCERLKVSPGWFDMRVNFRDPGFEHKEDLISGCNAAAAGGFTGVAVMPSTFPPVQTKGIVEYIKIKTENHLVSVYPIGCLSIHPDRKLMAEMYDMKLAGAVAFGDDKSSIPDSGLMIRAMLYAKNFDGLILSYADDSSISANGMMNEGIQSTLLGLKGMPSISEEIAISRDLTLAEYTGTRLHISTVSSAKSVELIRKAKAKGIRVTADVSINNIAMEESMLEEFDSNYKVLPPLRTAKDVEALKRGLKDGTIDAICSDHCPENEEMKRREFDDASFGIIGLETSFALANMHLRTHLSLEELIIKMAIAPRTLLDISVPIVGEGEMADLTLFDTENKWKLGKDQIKSKSRNTPFIDFPLKGKAVGVFNNGRFMKT